MVSNALDRSPSEKVRDLSHRFLLASPQYGALLKVYAPIIDIYKPAVQLHIPYLCLCADGFPAQLTLMIYPSTDTAASLTNRLLAGGEGVLGCGSHGSASLIGSPLLPEVVAEDGRLAGERAVVCTACKQRSQHTFYWTLLVKHVARYAFI
jgi:hypothetical protein